MDISDMIMEEDFEDILSTKVFCSRKTNAFQNILKCFFHCDRPARAACPIILPMLTKKAMIDLELGDVVKNDEVVDLTQDDIMKMGAASSTVNAVSSKRAAGGKAKGARKSSGSKGPPKERKAKQPRPAKAKKVLIDVPKVAWEAFPGLHLVDTSELVPWTGRRKKKDDATEGKEVVGTSQASN